MTQNSDAAPESKSGTARPDAEVAAPALNDARVADYLRRHPDFLHRNPALLDVLEPPRREEGGNVLDLQQAMVERLREELARLRADHDELIFTGRENLASQARVHEAALALLAAPSFEHLIEAVTSDLAVILDVDASILVVESEETAPASLRKGGLRQVPTGLVDQLMGGAQSRLLQGDLEEAGGGRTEGSIFGATAGLVRSQALLRLEISPNAPRALLALGARQPDRFHPGQGSELLGFLADTLSLVIRGWLELPE